MIRQPFFSVIVCTYQRAALLPRALDSLLAQTETDWEAVVVDDGSTDDSVSVVQKYALADARIRLITQEHRGLSASRNHAIDQAKGLFVTFLDSDDTYEPDHLAMRRQILIEYPMIDLLHGGCRVIGQSTVADRTDPAKLIDIADCVVGGTFVFRRDRLVQLGGFRDLPYADDADLYDRAEAAGFTIGRTDHASYVYYRDTPDSLCSTIHAAHTRTQKGS